jgi:hypothetical protein
MAIGDQKEHVLGLMKHYIIVFLLSSFSRCCVLDAAAIKHHDVVGQLYLRGAIEVQVQG